MQDNFSLLSQREIIEILDGGILIKENEEYRVQMPYLSGPKLCEICTNFGLVRDYWNSQEKCSRWVYMQELLDYTIKQNRCDELLQYLFDRRNFAALISLNSPDAVDAAYKDIFKSVIDKINTILYLGRHELQYIQGHFYVIEVGKKVVIEAPNIVLINMPYVQGLRERSTEDFNSGNYDSVITKSRTVIEEVLIYILEYNKIEIESKGDLNKIYNQVKNLYVMQQNKGYDGRVNSLLSGLEKIVMSVAEMRNVNSDSHGAGSKRIQIKECEARLVMNSAITFCEYMLSIYHNRKMESKKI